MTKPKTRCKECRHAEMKAIEEPCNKCKEIQLNKNSNNFFIPRENTGQANNKNIK